MEGPSEAPFIHQVAVSDGDESNRHAEKETIAQLRFDKWLERLSLNRP